MLSQKRLFDIIFSILALMILFPLILLIAVLVKLDSEGPIVHKQKRTGKDSRPFTLYKFRTMYKDAEKKGPLWSKNGDTRITKIGKVLRITNLDEIPQFYNVIMGEMSVVGPRPERPYFTTKFAKQYKNYNKRFVVKPGITGWAQVNGWYGDTSIPPRLKCDLEYIEKRSLGFDMKILLMTLKLAKDNFIKILTGSTEEFSNLNHAKIAEETITADQQPMEVLSAIGKDVKQP